MLQVVQSINESSTNDRAPPSNACVEAVVKIGGINCSRANRGDMVAAMLADMRLARSGELPVPRIVVAANGHVIALYHRDREFREMVANADIVDVDGMPLVVATHLLCRTPLRERVATTDLILDASEAAAQEGMRFFFLGAKPGVAQSAADNLTERYPGLDIVGVRHGYFSEAEEPAICDEIRASGADVLWLGLGSPLQDYFAYRNRERLGGLAWIRTCGGMFDYYSGDQPRAPMAMQMMGLEWLFRSIREPRRLGMRYLMTNPSAIYHILTKTSD